MNLAAVHTKSTPAFSSSGARRTATILAASLVVAATAHVVFPLPFSPVPLSLQPLAVLAVGLLLGPVDGFLALLAYLLEGAAGLPVFSPTGPGGIAQLVGPTGGYLLADPLVAFTAGALAQSLARYLPRYVSAFLACSVAIALLYLSGAGWLAHLLHLPVSAVWSLAIAPYLPGEVVKIAIAAGIFQTFSKRLSR